LDFFLVVGFSVATQLSSDRDKAKTFVGTPYWMSPEVIEAKSGIASYDEKADIWAMGITCIELAEVNPPLSEITPMRALFQIPVRDPPKLQNPKQWYCSLLSLVSRLSSLVSRLSSLSFDSHGNVLIVFNVGRPSLVTFWLRLL